MPWADWMTSVQTEELLIPFRVLFALVMTLMWRDRSRRWGFCSWFLSFAQNKPHVSTCHIYSTLIVLEFNHKTNERNKPPEHFPNTSATRRRNAHFPATTESNYLTWAQRRNRRKAVILQLGQFLLVCLWRTCSPPPPPSGLCTCPWWRAGWASRSACWIGP